MELAGDIVINLSNEKFRVYALDSLLVSPTNLYNDDGSINDNCCRTEIGQLHFDLKINNKMENISLISDKIVYFLNTLNETFDVIIPVPSSKNNNISMVCLDVSNRTNILLLDCIKKQDNDFIILNNEKLLNKKILIVDDSYKTGKTLINIFSKICDYSSNVVGLTFIVVR